MSEKDVINLHLEVERAYSQKEVTPMKPDETAVDRYERIAALAAERDRHEAKLDQVEQELRQLIYRFGSAEE